MKLYIVIVLFVIGLNANYLNCTIGCVGYYNDCVRGETQNNILCGCLSERIDCDNQNDCWNNTEVNFIKTRCSLWKCKIC